MYLQGFSCFLDGSTPSMDIGVSTVSFLIVIIAIAQLMSNGGGTHKQKGMYTSVEPSTSGVQLPIPEDSRVQYTVIDIRATHVS